MPIQVPGVPDELARLFTEEKEEGAERVPARSRKIGVTSMKRLVGSSWRR